MVELAHPIQTGRALTLSAAYKGFKKCLFKTVWDIWASGELDQLGRAILLVQFQFVNVLKQVPTCFSCLGDSAATLFCCEAPEMFCGLRSTQLSIGMGREPVGNA